MHNTLPHARSGRRAWARLGLGALLAVVAVFLGWAAAIVAFLGGAAVTSSDLALLTAAVVAALVVTSAISWVAVGITRLPRRRRVAAAVAVIGVAALALVSSLTVLRPLPATVQARRGPQVPAGMHYWTLPTGSRLAVLEVATRSYPIRPDPVIFVGGGPGEEDVADASQTEFFGQLSDFGFDVYFYDQVGSGLSERLKNPADYTVARQVADLDALRGHIGASQVILMGSSWGGSLVASYMARHPRHVARAIFTSPAPMDYAQWVNAGSPSSRLPTRQRQQADALLPGAPRFLLWYLLGEINPQAAHDFVSDHEADDYFNTYLHLVAPGTVCNPAHLPHEYETGNGLYDNIFTSRNAASGRAQGSVRAALAHDETPALILTGSCNYIPWNATREYATTLPNATLLCFHDAGHVIYLDRPMLYLRTISAFLLQQALPLKVWPTTKPC